MSNGADFICVLKPGRQEMISAGPTESEKAAIGKHVVYLQALTDAGTLRLAGHTENSAERTFGIIIFHADSLEAALGLVREDPAVSTGTLLAEVFQFSTVFGA